jgi:hypothetical protein
LPITNIYWQIDPVDLYIKIPYNRVEARGKEGGAMGKIFAVDLYLHL